MKSQIWIVLLCWLMATSAYALDEQVAGPIHNPVEMAISWSVVEQKLKDIPAYVEAFDKIYPDGITGKNVTDSIVEFERSLVTAKAPFDEWLQGNENALSELGDYFADRDKPITEADMGRFKVTGEERDRHYFKVPSLRLVAKTAPYFHDGSVNTLEEALTTMSLYQLGRPILEKAMQAIIAFLHSLEGTHKALNSK